MEIDGTLLLKLMLSTLRVVTHNSVLWLYVRALLDTLGDRLPKYPLFSFATCQNTYDPLAVVQILAILSRHAEDTRYAKNARYHLIESILAILSTARQTTCYPLGDIPNILAIISTTCQNIRYHLGDIHTAMLLT